MDRYHLRVGLSSHCCNTMLIRWYSNHKLNVTGRSQKDAIVALQIDAPSGKSFEYTTLQPSSYAGTAGDGLLSLVGMTGVDVSVDGEEDRVELLLVNARPSLDGVGQISLSQATGANSTIEVFEVRGRHSTTMNHLHTVAHKDISTPNNVALASGSRTRFYTTNDHGAHKVGLMAHLGGLLNVGNVVLCTVGQGCRVVSEGHKFPNGLAQHGGFVYVPSSMTGVIQVYRIKEDDELEKVEDIVIDYSLDNLSVDANGDIYVAAFPKGIDILLAFNDPLNAKPRSTIFRVRKGADGSHSWEKILEDGEGGTLPGATTVIHDAKTGRLFLSGKSLYMFHAKNNVWS